MAEAEEELAELLDALPLVVAEQNAPVTSKPSVARVHTDPAAGELAA